MGKVRAWGDLSGVQMGRILGKKRRVFLISSLFGLALLIAMVWIARPMAVLARISTLGAGGVVTFLTPAFHLGGEPVRVFSASDGLTRRSHEVIATVLIERLVYLIIIATLLLAGGIIGLKASAIPAAVQQGIIALAGGP